MTPFHTENLTGSVAQVVLHEYRLVQSCERHLLQEVAHLPAAFVDCFI